MKEYVNERNELKMRCAWTWGKKIIVDKMLIMKVEMCVE